MTQQHTDDLVTVTPLGHASCLIRIGPWTLVTDPVLEDGIGPGIGRVALGPRRLQPPALRARELGPVDAVLLSHAHWDHTDRRTLAALPRAAVAIVQRGNRGLVRRFPDRRALRWGERTTLAKPGRPPLEVTAVPARHWGARMVLDQWRGFGGFLIEAPDIPSPAAPGRPLAILFAGDTADHDGYRRLRAARGGAAVDIALMPIGAYNPWIRNHCTPEQALRMGVEDLGAERLVPIHYDTFRLSIEPFGEPMERLLAAAGDRGHTDRLAGTTYGDVVRVA